MEWNRMPVNDRVCEIHILGRVPFLEAWDLQRQISNEIAKGNHPDTLLLLEHPHTYTFGRRGDPQNLLWDEQTLKRQHIEVHWVDRGGDITYHGPGQLVGYPILQLDRVENREQFPKVDYVGYVRRLEKMLIQASAQVGIAAGQIPGNTGVWVQPDVASRCLHCPPAAKNAPSKLASIGVKIDAMGISQHGFALNVNPNRDYWDGIVACGDPDHPQISLADLLDPPPKMASVAAAVAQSFGSIFGYALQFTKPVMDIWLN
jgi:lipoate-protein ligase B